MKNDCELISKKNKINFNWNSKFPVNSLHIMRGYLFVEENKKKEYLKTFFNAYWQDDIDLTSLENIIKLLDNLSIDHKQFFEGINSIRSIIRKKFNINVPYFSFKQGICHF